MSNLRKLQQQRERRETRVRVRLKETTEFPRVSVFRSLKQIYAQLVDDNAHKTLTSCSSVELQGKNKKKLGDKKEIAFQVGKELAARARKQGIEQVRFDRGQYLFHGRVKALADGLREGGLKV